MMAGGAVQYLRYLGSSVYYGAAAAVPTLWTAVTQGRSAFAVKPRSRPAVLDDPDLGSHEFAKLKDVTLHYVTKGDRSKPLILFIHGYPELWYSWRHQIKDFSKDNWVVAMNMRGYSESDKPAGVASYSIANIVEDIRQLVQYLGRESCTVVAHDWGAIIGFSFASRHPELVDKLVICNGPHPQAWKTLIESSTEQRIKSWYVFMFQWPWLAETRTRMHDLGMIQGMLTSKSFGCKPGRITKEDVEAFKYTFQNYESLCCPINYYRAIFRYPPDQKYTGRIQAPTLVIWGTKDLALGEEVALASACYCDNHRIRYVEGASHWVQQDEPEIVNKYIREFIENPAMMKACKL